jgi:hypothetical protein
VHSQIQKQSKIIFSTIAKYDDNPKTHWTNWLGDVWQEVSLLVRESEAISIDELTVNLLEKNILLQPDSHEALLISKNLVFSIIGWQTMLFVPDTLSCPLSQLAIGCEMGCHQGQAHMCLKQNHSACRKHLYEFLLGYGMLLPPSNFIAAESAEDKMAFETVRSVAPTALNAHLLAAVGGVNIEWVDSLPCHLEFDARTNTLFLFRYPSFCIGDLPRKKATVPHLSVIHACAALPSASIQWATADEVTQMLRETVLSYRLLFGQNKASRNLFRRLAPFHGIPREGQD